MNAPTQNTERQPANTERVYVVSRDDLPLSCPGPHMELWNSHPRVYLPIEQTGTARCPYCGAVYQLEDRVEPDPDQD
ncbi:MAG: zinc-finger domain-containing protein [Pseudomonadota bacterium]